MNSFAILVLIVSILITGYISKVYSYMEEVETLMLSMQAELEAHDKDIDSLFNSYNEILKELDEMDGYEFYKIDTNKSLEENKELRDKYYTKEVLDSYDKETRSIIEECVLDDNKFEELYHIKTDMCIRFIELTEKKHEIFMQM